MAVAATRAGEGGTQAAADAIASNPEGQADAIVVARDDIPSAIVSIWVAA